MEKCKGRLALISLIVLMLIPLLGSTALAGSIQVITGQGTPVDTIEDGAIKKIFLGKSKAWPNGSPVEFVVLKSGDAHDAFLKTFVKKSASQFKTYWKKQVFTGKGKNPKSFASEKDLVAYVAGKTGAIGYVSSGTDIAGAKILIEK